MRTRTVLKAAFDIGRASQPSRLPPTFLLPCRARLHNASTTPTSFHNTGPEIPPRPLPSSEQAALNHAEPVHSSPRVESSVQSAKGQLKTSSFTPTDQTLSTPATPWSSTSPSSPQSPPPPPTASSPTPPSMITPTSTKKPLVLSASLQRLLPHLASQTPHYISAHIHRFPYLLTAGDVLRLPFHLHGVVPGDTLRLNRASLLGSRDYTLKAGTHTTELYDGRRTGEPNYLDERLFECRVRVMGVDSGPMVVEEKTKRRQRRVRHVHSKHKYTVLRVVDVKVKSLAELERTGEMLVLG